MTTFPPTPVTLATIEAARERIRGAVSATPCPYSLSLSRLCGANVFCKLDHLQMTGSFKERGARNKLLQLPADQKRAGVIAASAGNHAQALAYHGGLLKIPVTVVMPETAPLVKINSCAQLGAEVVLFGRDFDQARERAIDLAMERKLEMIHGFDDPDIIAGQGTVGLEILEEVPAATIVFVPIGGGGLIAGISLAIKSLRPDIRIIGVEPANAPTFFESRRAGHPVKIPVRPTLADGLAVAEVGRLCFEIAKDRVDEVMLVDEENIARSMLRMLEHEKMVVEGAGAVTLAAAMAMRNELAGKTCVLCLSGGNVDVTTISRVIERGLAADGRLCRFTAFVSDRPGSLAELSQIIAATGASIKEVAHDRYFAPADIALVTITCTLETRNFAHVEIVRAALIAAHVRFEMKT